ncbi:hypothetical protein V1520DRAFT_219703 [Lipomyces starkeyi]
MSAFSVVEVPSFKSFVNGIIPKYALPTGKTVTRMIVSVSAYSSLVNDMKANRTHLTPMTYDVLTSKANLPYAGVTVHYVDPDWKLLRDVIRTLLWTLLSVSG